MLCEHPACTSDATRVCEHHCHLSLCRQHCLEHENNFLQQFQDQLDQLRQPVSRLINQTQNQLKTSEECRQNELKRINEIFDHYLSVINQRSQLLKMVEDFIRNKRDVIRKCKTGDQQLTREQHEELENFYKNLQENLQDQYELTKLLTTKDRQIDPSSTVHVNSTNDIECIELSDSENDQSENTMECGRTDEPNTSLNTTKESLIIKKTNEPWHSKYLSRYRDVCPLTKLGVFGLKKSHNMKRFCPEVNQERCLYGHFVQTHRIKPSITNKLVKAVATGADPMTTIIFPDDDSFMFKNDIACPINGQILNTSQIVCRAMLNDLNLKYHLTNVHKVNREDAILMHRLIKSGETIDQTSWHFQSDSSC